MACTADTVTSWLFNRGLACVKQRLLGGHVSEQLCMQSDAWSILDYAAIIWSLHTQKDINIQKKSSKNNFSYANITQMLTNLNWPLTLAECREQKAIMMFKITNHLVDISANSYLTPVPMYVT